MAPEDPVATLMELLVCPNPDCEAPATVVDRFVLESTSGPVEHVKTLCVNDHGLTPRTESVRSWSIMQAHRPPRAAGA